jgi:hypothetical protein
MKVYSSTLLAATIITIFATTQSDTGIQTNDSKSFSNRYDSSYDFSEISRQNRNPKELIGQELEFAPPSSNHVVGSKASLFYQLRDSLFICFSWSKTKKLSELTDVFPENSTGFGLVDCTRYPFNYSYQFLKDSATTNAYKPEIVLTDAYPFYLRMDKKDTKKAIVVGTPYSSLAGKTFKIKDASCYFEYYDSRVSYFFNLIDPEDNEVTLYFAFNQPLEQMIHIKGYRKKVEESFSKKSFSFVSSFKVKIESEPVLMGYQMSPDYFKTKINLYNKNWIAGEYKYVSTPERYFQMLYLELKNDQGEKIYIWLYDMPD